MPDSFIENNDLTPIGISSTIGAIFMNIYNWCSVENINSFVVLFTTVFASFYMFYKFRNERMMYKKRKNDEKNNNKSD